MTIKGTAKIRGILDLPLSRLQVKANQTIYLEEEDFWKSDIQNAISLGFLINTDKKSDKENQVKDRMIRCKNIYGRPISIPSFQDEIKNGQVFTVQESMLQQDSFRRALAAHMIQVLDVVGGTKALEEGSVDLASVEAEEAPKTETEQKKTKPSKKKKIGEGEGAVKLDKKQFESEAQLETNAELPTPNKVIDVPNPEPITKDDIGDPKKNTVVWNPSNNPIINELNNQDSPEVEELKTTEVKDPRKCSVVWNPTKGKPDIIRPKEGEDPEPSFVDKEQEQQNIGKHPKMAKKDLPNNQEINFVQ
jgi:hypothetical protein